MNDLLENLERLRAKVNGQVDLLTLDEETTKQVLIEPFLQALGYDTNDHSQVRRQYRADRRGGRNSVDFALIDPNEDSKPTIFVECKPTSNSLGKQEIGQLGEYMASTLEVWFGLLTNGVVYRFYGQVDNKNLMDETPTIEFLLPNFESKEAEPLFLFAREGFDKQRSHDALEALRHFNCVVKEIQQELHLEEERGQPQQTP